MPPGSSPAAPIACRAACLITGPLTQAETMQSIEHPNIVQCLGSQVPCSVPFFALCPAVAFPAVLCCALCPHPACVPSMTWS